MVKTTKSGAKKTLSKKTEEVKSKPITSKPKPAPKPSKQPAKSAQKSGKTSPKPAAAKKTAPVKSQPKPVPAKKKAPIKTQAKPAALKTPVKPQSKVPAKPAVVPKPNLRVKSVPAKAAPAAKTEVRSKSTPKPSKAKPVQAKKPEPSPAAKVQKAEKEEETKIVKAVRKGRAAVDNECPKAKDCHVFEEGAKVWTVTLNQADLKNNANKYYIIQLLQSDSSANQFFVWNRWGRVGYAGQNALKGPFSDLNRAKADYEGKFRDKTRGGYIEVQIVYEEENEVKKETPKSVKTKAVKEAKSSLDKRVSDLMNLIFDLKSINRTLAEIGYDSKKMPLGKLSSATIKQGLQVLKQIESDLNSGRKWDLEALSSRFYSLIPHDFGFQKMSNFIINNNEKLKQKVEMLESLADMKIATNILEETTGGNPVDDHYSKLNCKLTPLDKSDPVYALLEKYVDNTHGNTHSYYTLSVENIFRVDKPGESDKFIKNIKNNMLLWHGSRLTNWAGILSQGLRIAPPEAPVSGYMFGKGVYFADMVSKSANYCFTSKENNTGILLLCDVAVGAFNEKIHSDYNASNLPKGKHSTKGCGLNAPPEKTYKTLEGCKVPLGPAEKVELNGGYLQYNEYIVYNTNQIKMKFLLRVKFNYKY